MLYAFQERIIMIHSKFSMFKDLEQLQTNDCQTDSFVFRFCRQGRYNQLCLFTSYLTRDSPTELTSLYLHKRSYKCTGSTQAGSMLLAAASSCQHQPPNLPADHLLGCWQFSHPLAAQKGSCQQIWRLVWQILPKVSSLKQLHILKLIIIGPDQVFMLEQ